MQGKSMPDEPSREEWTVTTLLAHIQEIIQAERRYIDARLISIEDTAIATQLAMDKAITKTEHAMEKRFESVNQFRESLRDQTKEYLTKNEYDSRHVDMERRLLLAEKWMAERAGYPARLAEIERRLESMDKILSEGLGRTGQQLTTRNTLYFIVGSLLNLAMAAGALGFVLWKH